MGFGQRGGEDGIVVRSQRAAVALAFATFVHVVALVVLRGQVSLEVKAKDTRHITFTFVDARPLLQPVTKTLPYAEPLPHKRSAPPLEQRPLVDAEPPIAQAPSQPSAASELDAAASTATGARSYASPVGPRVPTRENKMRDVVRGTTEGPLPSIATLESATGIHVVGPESDIVRAGRVAQANLAHDLAAHDVARRLADHWFHRRRNDIARTWQPQDRELNDGGKEVRATELFARTLMNPLHWKDASRAISAAFVAGGPPPGHGVRTVP